MRLYCSGLVLSLAMLLAAGCSMTPPSQHYFLAPLAVQDGAAKASDPTSDITVVEVQVRIAHYLDRPQIVTRIGPNEFRLDEFNRWTGSFKDNITNALVQNLTALLSNTVVVRRPVPSSLPVNYLAFIDIIQFDGIPGQSVTLLATWGVLEKEDDKTAQTLRPESFNVTVPLASKDYDRLVHIKSRILADLSREIAQAIAGLNEKPGD